MRIITNLHVLSLSGIDVVLGNAWLRSIEKILHNFEDMTMEFKLDNKKRRWVTVVTK